MQVPALRVLREPVACSQPTLATSASRAVRRASPPASTRVPLSPMVSVAAPETSARPEAASPASMPRRAPRRTAVTSGPRRAGPARAPASIPARSRSQEAPVRQARSALPTAPASRALQAPRALLRAIPVTSVPSTVRPASRSASTREKQPETARRAEPTRSATAARARPARPVNRARSLATPATSASRAARRESPVVSTPRPTCPMERRAVRGTFALRVAASRASMELRASRRRFHATSASPAAQEARALASTPVQPPPSASRAAPTWSALPAARATRARPVLRAYRSPTLVTPAPLPARQVSLNVWTRGSHSSTGQAAAEAPFVTPESARPASLVEPVYRRIRVTSVSTPARLASRHASTPGLMDRRPARRAARARRACALQERARARLGTTGMGRTASCVRRRRDPRCM